MAFIYLIKAFCTVNIEWGVLSKLSYLTILWQFHDDMMAMVLVGNLISDAFRSSSM